MNFDKENKGITLIALVVTIIVLLILAGISISMLTGKNGILNRANESKYTNEISGFEEKVKLAQISLQASITQKTKARAGYIATKETNSEPNFSNLANEVADEFDVTAVSGNAGTTKINTEGYTVGYYLDTGGSEEQEGNGYITIWYTNNSLRSTIDREEAKSKYGIVDVAQATDSRNQTTLVAVIQVENYGCTLSNTGLTSIADGDNDIENKYFQNTSINEKLATSNSSLPEEKEEDNIEKILCYNMKASKKMENVKNLESLQDRTDNGNNADLKNVSLNNEQNGIMFNGTSSYGEIDLKVELTFPLTIEMDISSTANSSQVIFLDSKSKTAFGYYSGYFICTANTNYLTTYTIPNNFFDGNIKHVVVTYNSIEDFVVYVNGEKCNKSSATNYWSTSGSKCYLGRRSSGTYFNGILYNFRIFNRIFNENEYVNTTNRDDMILEYSKDSIRNERRFYRINRHCR